MATSEMGTFLVGTFFGPQKSAFKCDVLSVCVGGCVCESALTLQAESISAVLRQKRDSVTDFSSVLGCRGVTLSLPPLCALCVTRRPLAPVSPLAIN